MLNEANSVLSETSQRAEYDLKLNRPLIGGFMSNRGGAVKYVSVLVTLQDIFSQATKTVSFTRISENGSQEVVTASFVTPFNAHVPLPVLNLKESGNVFDGKTGDAAICRLWI